MTGKKIQFLMAAALITLLPIAGHAAESVKLKYSAGLYADEKGGS